MAFSARTAREGDHTDVRQQACPGRSLGTSRKRGQAMTEYILLIGLVSIFILSALILFRNAIVDFTKEVVAALESSEEPVAEPPPPSPPQVAANPPTPSASSTPTATPLIEGRRCASYNNLLVRRTGPDTFRVTRIDPNGGGPPPEFLRITVSEGGRRITARDPDGRAIFSATCE